MARPRRSGRRADYSWSGIIGRAPGVGTTATLGSGLITFTTPLTIVRVRGQVLVRLEGGTAGDVYVGGCGLILATDAAVAAGAAAIPSPSDVLDAEWLWHAWCPMETEDDTATEELGTQVLRLEIDSKAMRKVKSNMNLVFMADGIRLAGSSVSDWTYGIRVLVAE